MAMSGYKFEVFTEGFLLHDGLKEFHDLHPTWKDELERNIPIYEQFVEKLKIKYPDSKVKCIKS